MSNDNVYIFEKLASNKGSNKNIDTDLVDPWTMFIKINL